MTRNPLPMLGLSLAVSLAVSAPLAANATDIVVATVNNGHMIEMQKLTQTADALDLARVSNHGGIVIERRAPRVDDRGRGIVVLLRCGRHLAAAPGGHDVRPVRAEDDRSLVRGEYRRASAAT